MVDKNEVSDPETAYLEQLERLPALFVAALVITCKDKILAIYNPLWGGFTLPMTKLRPDETWMHAAVRVGTEYTGKLFDLGWHANLQIPIKSSDPVWPKPTGYFRNGEVRQGDRDGVVKLYNFHVFGLDLDEEMELSSCHKWVWLTAIEFQNTNLCPITGSGRDIIKTLMQIAADQDKSFPDRTIKWHYLRSSLGALAVITQNKGGVHKWLMQWNNKWGMYNLVGGHKEEGESFRDCMIREIKEELTIDEKDFVLPEGAGVPLEYDDFSISAQKDTSYTFEIFHVMLLSSGAEIVEHNPENKWVTKEEILGHKCKADGRPISRTVEIVLKKMGWLSTKPNLDFLKHTKKSTS